MAYFIFKTFTTALVIASVSEISKRYSFLASLLTALPITSLLIFIWMYVEQRDVQKISLMSFEVFLLVIPSLVFFLILPLLLKRGVGFYTAVTADVFITYAIYVVYLKFIKLLKPDLEL